jgi:hypothetical protein
MNARLTSFLEASASVGVCVCVWHTVIECACVWVWVRECV